MVIAIGEKSHLQGFYQVSSAFCSGEQGWNHDHSAQINGDSLRKIHSRQQIWHGQFGHQPVDEGDYKLAGSDEYKNAENSQGWAAGAVGMRFYDQDFSKKGGSYGDHA